MEKNIMEYVPDAQFTYLNATHRMGEPWVTKLREIYDDIESAAEHKTEFEIVHLPYNVEKQVLVNLCLKYKIDVTLTIYTSNMFYLKKQIGTVSEVYKVHGYQGDETDNLMVVLRGNNKD